MTVLAQLDTAATEAVASVARFLPRLAACIAILLIGYLLARLVRRLLVSLLRRIGVGYALNRGGIRGVLARADYDVDEVLSRLVFYGAMLLVLQVAFGVFGPNPVSDLLFRLLTFLPRIVVAVIIIVVASFIGSAVRDVIRTLIGGLSYGYALATAVHAVIMGIGVFAALDQVEIAETIVTGVFYAALATVVGVTVVAVGGSGIVPLRQFWERGLTRLEHETHQIRDAAQQQRHEKPPSPATPDPSDVAAVGDEGDPTVPLDTVRTTTQLALPDDDEPEPEPAHDYPDEPALPLDGVRTTTQIARPDDEPEPAHDRPDDSTGTTLTFETGRATTQVAQLEDDSPGRAVPRRRRTRRNPASRE